MTIQHILFALFMAKNHLEKTLKEIDTLYNNLVDIRNEEIKNAKKSTQDIEQER